MDNTFETITNDAKAEGLKIGIGAREVNAPISPVECKHTKLLFIQSGRWTGIDEHGSEQVYVCPACGKFIIHAMRNGQYITVEFELCLQDQVDAAGQYIKYLCYQDMVRHV